MLYSATEQAARADWHKAPALDITHGKFDFSRSYKLTSSVRLNMGSFGDIDPIPSGIATAGSRVIAHATCTTETGIDMVCIDLETDTRLRGWVRLDQLEANEGTWNDIEQIHAASWKAIQEAAHDRRHRQLLAKIKRQNRPGTPSSAGPSPISARPTNEPVFTLCYRRASPARVQPT